MERTGYWEPELVTIIKRTAELEASAFLSPSEMSELNSLRRRLMDGWPQVALALAHAYMATV